MSINHLRTLKHIQKLISPYNVSSLLKKAIMESLGVWCLWITKFLKLKSKETWDNC